MVQWVISVRSIFTVTGWWFGTMEFYDFPFSNFIIPTDEDFFFQRGRLKHQPGRQIIPMCQFIVGDLSHWWKLLAYSSLNSLRTVGGKLRVC